MYTAYFLSPYNVNGMKGNFFSVTGPEADCGWTWKRERFLFWKTERHRSYVPRKWQWAEPNYPEDFGYLICYRGESTVELKIGCRYLVSSAVVIVGRCLVWILAVLGVGYYNVCWCFIDVCVSLPIWKLLTETRFV